MKEIKKIKIESIILTTLLWVITITAFIFSCYNFKENNNIPVGIILLIAGILFELLAIEAKTNFDRIETTEWYLFLRRLRTRNN